MRYGLFISLTVILCAALCVLSFAPSEYLWVLYVLLVVALLLLFLLFRSVILPSQTVRHGLDLIAAQDFNNRLVKVGEPEADRLVKLFNTMIDKLRSERLRNMERESFLQLLIEASPMGVVMLDFDDKVSLVNPSFLKIAGLSLDENVTGIKVEDVPSELARRMGDVPLGTGEVIRRGDISRYRVYHLSFLQSGFRRRFYLLESLTEEVMKAERSAYEKVIRIISHEVNNTMGGVRSVLGMLHDLAESDDIREVVESCDDRCDRMTRFISSYADVVRVPEPVKATVAINKMVSDMEPFLQGLVPEGITLIMDSRGNDSLIGSDDGEKVGSGKDFEAELDIVMMQQVIVNIVKNAVESFPKSDATERFPKDEDASDRSDSSEASVQNTAVRRGNIWISTYMSGERAVLEISNNGEPISEELSMQLFSPFFTTKREGRGIGLTLISEILNRHGATYSLKTGPDGITRFTIWFRV